MDQKNEGVFLATLKSKPTKAGGCYYEGKLGNIVTIKAFHKKDGTGIVLRLENAPMPGDRPNPSAHPYSPQAPPQSPQAPVRVKPRITPRPQTQTVYAPLPPSGADDPPEGMWDEDWGIPGEGE